MFCDECGKEHDNNNEIINNEFNEIKVVPIIKKQYYCKQHHKKVNYYCNFCKKNLYENKCLSEYYHIKMKN